MGDNGARYLNWQTIAVAGWGLLNLVFGLGLKFNWDELKAINLEVNRIALLQAAGRSERTEQNKEILRRLQNLEDRLNDGRRR